MGETPSKEPAASPRALIGVAVAVLWLVTVLLGLFAVYNLHALSMLAFQAIKGHQFTPSDFNTGRLIGYLVIFFGGLGWIATAILSGEYHLKHAGEVKSWKIIAWFLGIEILIIAVGYFIGRIS